MAASYSKPLLLSDMASKIDRVPNNYIRPESDRPNLSEVETLTGTSIPCIDLHGLFGPNRAEIVKQIGQACEQHGFFQV